jgi:diguanylate cyclase (GGDEF)-like protein
MFIVIDCVLRQHDYRLVLLAAAVLCVGSLAFFLILKRTEECGIRRKSQWTALGAVAGGIAVWATHFIAMLAYDGGMPIGFNMARTVLSAVVSIFMFWLTLHALRSQSRFQACVLGGVLATVGVDLMHFIGTSAIIASADISYDVVPIIITGLVAVLIYTSTFAVFFSLRGAAQVLAPAGLFVIAVCVLHFVGMSYTTLIANPLIAGPETAFSKSWLLGGIVAASTIILLLAAAATFVDRYLTDLRGLADATLEGIAIVQSEKIAEINDRFAKILDIPAASIIGRSLDEFLTAADGEPASALRDLPVEATLRGDSQGRFLEIIAHGIEYRGKECRVIAVRDLSEKKEAQRQIEHLAHHDPLTGLPNRTLFEDRLRKALKLAHRTGEPVAVLALDLDRFKSVNDIFGHGEGDRVLCRVADILRTSVRASDTVARIGGDEFVILQIGGAQPEGSRALADRIISDFAEKMDRNSDPTAVGLSIGVAVFPDDARDAEGLRHAADIALYRAKQSGRGQACFHDSALDVEVRQRRKLEHDLRHAVLRRQLRVVYQPLVVTSGGRVYGYEALVRWTHPEQGAIPPDVFIPIAEESGSILAIGEWVLREGCRTVLDWPDSPILAVNVSAVQFQLHNLAETIVTILEEEKFPPSRLELELTESALMKDRAIAITTLDKLKRLGVSIVIDDFGTGYSSLSNLQSFPFDKIKIDRSFVSVIESDDVARSIVRAIVGIGKSLGMDVVAEGVETHAQHRMLMEEKCPLAQGYLFGRPSDSPAEYFLERESAEMVKAIAAKNRV